MLTLQSCLNVLMAAAEQCCVLVSAGMAIVFSVGVRRLIQPLYSTYRTSLSDLGLRERARELKTTGGRGSAAGIAKTQLWEAAAQLSHSFMLCTACSASNWTIASFLFRRVALASIADTLSRSPLTLLWAPNNAYEYEVAGRLQCGQSFSGLGLAKTPLCKHW